MNITIISTFRDAESYLDRYCDQMDALQTLLNGQGHHLHLLLGYGDSSDDTDALLFEKCVYRFDALLVNVTHNGAKYGSIEHPERFRQLAYVGNTLLDCVADDADAVGIVESDLIWDALTLSDLIAHLAQVPAIAPMVMDGPYSFYDSFAFRRNGQRFTKTPPYHPDLDKCCEGLVQVDSAGSVLFMQAEIAKKVRFPDDNAIVGLCDGINASGGSIWLDPTLSVAHPPYDGRPQRQSDSRGASEPVRL